jgi:hypothetical protein
MLICLLISSFFSTSSAISVDVSWFTSLNKDSPDYGKHLYCGTVARGATYLNEKDTVADPLGVTDGVEEILELKDLKFTGVEIKWIQDQISLIGKNNLFGRGPDIKPSLIKIYLNLWMHKTVDSSSPNLATMLKHIESLKRIKDDQATQYFAYLNDFHPSKDPLCEEFRQKLFSAVQNHRYFIPEFTLVKNIENAIKHGIKCFAEKKGIRELYVYSVYFHVAYLEYKINPNAVNRRKFGFVLETLANKYKPTKFTDTLEKLQIRILLDEICNKLQRIHGLNFLRIEIILKVHYQLGTQYYNPPNLCYIPVLDEIAREIVFKIPPLEYLKKFIKEDKEWLMLCPGVEIILAKYNVKW